MIGHVRRKSIGYSAYPGLQVTLMYSHVVLLSIVRVPPVLHIRADADSRVTVVSIICGLCQENAYSSGTAVRLPWGRTTTWSGARRCGMKGLLKGHIDWDLIYECTREVISRDGEA